MNPRFVLPPVLLALSGRVHPQPAPPAIPKFEVVSVKPCKDNSGGRSGGSDSSSPGRLSLNCATVKGLISQALVLYANGRAHPINSARLVPVEGGPGWIGSERYQIDAKAEGQPGQAMMRGPMLEALLAERFQLKIHRESRELPVYAVTVGKGGLKLKPSEEGACTPSEYFLPSGVPGPRRPAAPGEKPRCIGPRLGSNGPNRTFDLQAVSLDQFCDLLSSDGPMLFGLDRPVVNRTGIAGNYDIHFEFTGGPAGRGARTADPAVAAGPLPDADGPSIFAVLQQLGLKVEPAKGPRDFLVIDRVERPTEN